MAMEAGTVPFRDSDKLLFLASEPQWSQRLGEGWKGIKFLGRGAFGVVGLWEYQGDPSAPPAAPKITKVVVKMSCDEPMDQANLVFGTKSPFEEGWMLEQLAKAGSPHIIRQYGGNKIGDRFGDMDKVVRIFLEYCPGGDLDQFVGPVGGKAEDPLREVDLWTIFRCLAKGVAVLDRGTENPNEQPWDAPYPEFPEICHYDIKPDNILLGNRDRNHKRLPVAKIADFGEAMWLPSMNKQDDEYGRIITLRGNTELSAPENTFRMESGEIAGPNFAHIPLHNPRKGTCTNIFQIGGVMNILMKGQKVNFNKNGDDPNATLEKTYHPMPGYDANQGLSGYDNPTLPLNYHHAIGLDNEDCKMRFSSTLRRVVKHCMVRDPLMRQNSSMLLHMTAQGLAMALEAVKSTPLPPLPKVLLDRAVPFTKIANPEPPLLWTITTDELELDLRDMDLSNPENIPSAPQGGGSLLRQFSNVSLGSVRSLSGILGSVGSTVAKSADASLSTTPTTGGSRRTSLFRGLSFLTGVPEAAPASAPGKDAPQEMPEEVPKGDFEPEDVDMDYFS